MPLRKILHHFKPGGRHGGAVELRAAGRLEDEFKSNPTTIPKGALVNLTMRKPLARASATAHLRFPDYPDAPSPVMEAVYRKNIRARGDALFLEHPLFPSFSWSTPPSLP